jgi:hypothetical protein
MEVMMGKRKNRTQYVTWEDLKIIINSYKQVLESDLGNRYEDINDTSGSISDISSTDLDSEQIFQRGLDDT